MFERSADPLQDALTWLTSDPDDDLDVELTGVVQCAEVTAEVADTTLPAPQRQELLDLLCQRVLDVSGRFRPGLLTCSLPVPLDLHTKASSLIETLLSIAAQLRTLHDDMRHRKLWTRQGELSELCALALGLYGETYLLGTLLGAAAPFGMWQHVHDAWIASNQYERLKDNAEALPSKVNQLYKRLLAMAVSRPESLTAREQQWLFDYLETIGGDLVLSSKPLQPGWSTYWFDPNQDMAPVASIRRTPDKGREVVYFSPVEIVHRIGVQVLWLEKGLLDLDVSARNSGDSEILEVGSAILPLGLTPVEILSLLRRLRDQWASPPERGEARTRQHYTVQVCAGLKSVWAMGRDAQMVADEWTVYNESPGGYGILCVGGLHRSLAAGMILALRRDPTQEWTLCVVRWVRTDSPQQIELGLQVLGQGYAPVSICFHGNDALVPALMMQATSAGRHRTMVAAAGTYVSNNFVLVHEARKNVYVAQGSAFGLDLQTATIELFQYEVDIYAK
jgi:hypothetical protein